MLSLSKHVGKGLCARPFDKLRVTGLFGMHIRNNKHVIARYEAIPYLQSNYANPICTVGDCFVPRNDGGKSMVF
jgi:hypothetical protein